MVPANFDERVIQLPLIIIRFGHPQSTHRQIDRYEPHVKGTESHLALFLDDRTQDAIARVVVVDLTPLATVVCVSKGQLVNLSTLPILQNISTCHDFRLFSLPGTINNVQLYFLHNSITNKPSVPSITSVFSGYSFSPRLCISNFNAMLFVLPVPGDYNVDVMRGTYQLVSYLGTQLYSSTAHSPPPRTTSTDSS